MFFIYILFNKSKIKIKLWKVHFLSNKPIFLYKNIFILGFKLILVLVYVFYMSSLSLSHVCHSELSISFFTGCPFLQGFTASFPVTGFLYDPTWKRFSKANFVSSFFFSFFSTTSAPIGFSNIYLSCFHNEVHLLLLSNGEPRWSNSSQTQLWCICLHSQQWWKPFFPNCLSVDCVTTRT